jgi:hypothetical protein
MTIQRPINNRGNHTKRALGVQAVLEWAFRVEKGGAGTAGAQGCVR